MTGKSERLDRRMLWILHKWHRQSAVELAALIEMGNKSALGRDWV